jgi:hypothetical protein
MMWRGCVVLRKEPSRSNVVDEKIVPKRASPLSVGGNLLYGGMYGGITRSEAGADKMDGETKAEAVEKRI